MPKNIARTSYLKNVTIYCVYIIIIWGFYRFLFQLPDTIEELVVKPVIWLIPIIFLLVKEHLNLGSLGLTFKNLLPAILISLGLGVIFVAEAIFANLLKYGHFNFSANLGAPFLASLGISFATAFSEETAFRGYIFSRLLVSLKNEWTANFIQAVAWTVIHIPIAFFVLNYTVSQGIVYLVLTAIFGIGSAFIFARAKNVWGSILLHVLWEWPIILFR